MALLPGALPPLDLVPGQDEEWSVSFYTVWWWVTMRFVGVGTGTIIFLIALAVLREEHLRRMTRRHDLSARLRQARVMAPPESPTTSTAAADSDPRGGTPATPDDRSKPDSTLTNGSASSDVISVEAWTVAEVRFVRPHFTTLKYYKMCR